MQHSRQTRPENTSALHYQQQQQDVGGSENTQNFGGALRLQLTGFSHCELPLMLPLMGVSLKAASDGCSLGVVVELARCSKPGALLPRHCASMREAAASSVSWHQKA